MPPHRLPHGARNIVDGAWRGGNYWCDYKGTDPSGRGIGQAPYTAGGALASTGSEKLRVSVPAAGPKLLPAQ